MLCYLYYIDVQASKGYSIMQSLEKLDILLGQAIISKNVSSVLQYNIHNLNFINFFIVIKRLTFIYTFNTLGCVFILMINIFTCLFNYFFIN